MRRACPARAYGGSPGHAGWPARTSFPDRWREPQALRRCPHLASWVGYDLDGRADIHWSQSLTFRLTRKGRRSWRGIADRLGALHGRRDGKVPGLRGLARRLSRLRAAAKDADADAEPVRAGPDRCRTLWSRAANALTGPRASACHPGCGRDHRPCSMRRSRPQAMTPSRPTLIAFRAEVASLQQLGTARIHLRVNAAQVRTVINRGPRP